MQQQQGGGGGPGQQFGLHPPEMPPFSPAGQRISMAEAPSPISSRPPAPPGQQQLSSNELAGAAAAMSFDEEALAAGEEGGGGGSGGNRWPQLVVGDEGNRPWDERNWDGASERERFGSCGGGNLWAWAGQRASRTPQTSPKFETILGLRQLGRVGT